MNPKVWCSLPGLIAPQHQGSQMPTVYALTAPATPVYEWPKRREPLEGDHPGHGETPLRAAVWSAIEFTLS
jgi:hypothetical protein